MGNDQQLAGNEPVDVQTTATETTRSVDVQTTTAAPQAESGEMAKVRELVLKAHPDVVPDLVRGNSVDELIASVEPARSAYQRIADRVRESRSREGEQIVAAGRSREEQETFTTPDSRLATPVVQPPQVPAGGASNVAEPAELGPTTKIAQALAGRRRK